MRLRLIVRVLFALPSFLAYRLSRSKGVLDADIARWRERERIKSTGARAFFNLMGMPEFRSLVTYRIPASRHTIWMCGPQAVALYINTPGIGPGLYFQHGFATIVHAKSIGKNCSINQQVTIGFNGAGKFPVIGDNVSIRAGAKVLGDIVLGDNVIVGAGAVVTKSVPPNCVVVGVPAYIIKRDGIRCREELT
jgi:serine O-acetyltransferase